ncbi:MAG TPA: hypothetical protein VEA99_06530, partial [Gemmatimonadaceae bacterium]|nr:hypothetical protein [Gemmatimonadaceae bacterium]
ARSIQSSGGNPLLLHADAGELAPPLAEYGTASMLLQELGHVSAVDALPTESLAVLAHLVPKLAARHAALERPVTAAPRESLVAAARAAIEAAAREAPVLIVADSLSDADEDSRAMLAALAERVRGAVLMVLVLRPDDVGLALLEQLRRHLPTGRVVALDPFTVDDVAALLDAVTPMASMDRAELAREIHAEAGGVPRYVVAEVEALHARGLLGRDTRAAGTVLARLEGHKLPVPDKLRAELERRLRGLDEGWRRTLDAAAVLSGPFAAADVARLTGQSTGEAAQTLAGLARLGLVTASDGRHAIHPPVVERALYSLIPPLRREALHAAAAKLPAGSRPWHRITERAIEAVSEAPAAAGATPGRRWRMAAVALVLLVGVALTVVLARQSREPAPALTHSVVIFPFDVRGDGKVAYLESGMMDLLSTSLDGVGGYRTVDPRVVLASIRGRAPVGKIAPGFARRITERFGATYFVIGSVVSADGRLQVSASLHDMRRGGEVAARASAFGGEDALFGIIDRVTAQLAVAQGAASGERLAQLAAVTTSSLDALKAYLEARTAYRANDLTRALPAFERAVAADSTFALAWYGMATTASWMLRSGLEQRASMQAVRQSGRLSARDRTIVEAMAAYAHGRADTAEAKARTIAETYDDLEGWVLLGEVRFHHNWKRGRSMSEARQAWERVLALDPHHWPAMQHLSEIAAVEGRQADADSLLAAYEREVGADHVLLGSRALRAHLRPDSAARVALRPTLAADRGFFLINSIFYVAVFARDVAGAASLTQLLLEPSRSAEQQGFARVLRAHLALAQGRWREARMELALARRHTPQDAAEHQLALTLAPFLATPDSALRRERAELARLPQPTVVSSATLAWPQPHATMHRLLRTHLLGLADARTGDEPARLAAIRALESMPDPTGTTALARGFAHTLRAEALLRAGRRAAALEELERGARETAFVPGWTSAFVSQAYERWRRAELLRELGRRDEALRWYATFAENSPYDLVYLGPALYWQGRLLEERGDRAGARDRYARFVLLWRDADPELQRLVEDARGRMR